MAGEDGEAIMGEAQRRAGLNESAKEDVILIEASREHEAMSLVQVFKVGTLFEQGKEVVGRRSSCSR